MRRDTSVRNRLHQVLIKATEIQRKSDQDNRYLPTHYKYTSITQTKLLATILLENTTLKVKEFTIQELRSPSD